jgi:lycopene beta-cyclase
MGGSGRCDLAILGGGLAGGLIAHAMRVKRPEVSVRLFEAQPVLGGNHVWSFFANDVAPEHRWIVEPFISHSWNGYDVIFPAHRRSLGVRYHSVRSSDYNAVLRRLLAPDTPVQAKVARTTATRIVLADGSAVDAGGVIDARGPGDLTLMKHGWQKFLGREFRMSRPHGVAAPIVMDAAVPQHDGYRFVYVLPFDAHRLFIEDTYYSDGPTLDPPLLRERIDDYAAQHGWQIGEVLSEETGALPVVLDGAFEAYWQSGGERVAKAGARAALFHPTTGYSLPDAVRLAAHLIALDDLSGEALHKATHDFAARAWQERGFYRMLDKMLFLAADDDERYRVLERFYRLSPRLVERFYAARSTRLDKLRILSGRPPVSMRRAIKAIMGTAQ